MKKKGAKRKVKQREKSNFVLKWDSQSENEGMIMRRILVIGAKCVKRIEREN